MIGNISAFYLSSFLTLCVNHRAHLRSLIETDGSFTHPVAHLSTSVKIQSVLLEDNTHISSEF